MNGEQRVRELFRQGGEPGMSGANAPMLLEDPTSVWLVTEGKLDVFAVNIVNDAPEGPRNHLFSVPAGGLVFGVEPAWAGEVGLLAVGTPGTGTLRLPLARLQADDVAADAKPLIDQYVLAFSTAVAHRSTPRFDILLSAEMAGTVEEDTAVGARRGVVWVSVEAGTLLFDAYARLPVDATAGPFPLAFGAWALAGESTSLRVLSDPELLSSGSLWQGLQSFQRVALEWADEVLASDRAAERLRLKTRSDADRSVSRSALESLAGVIVTDSSPPLDTTGGELLTACRLVGESLRIDFRPPPAWDRGKGAAADELRAISRASGVGMRRVVLSPGWWERDSGPLLAFRVAEGESDESGVAEEVLPLALLPKGPGRYQAVEPTTGQRTDVDDSQAAALSPFGYQFYRSLPARALKLKDLWRFVMLNTGGDLRVLLYMGFLGAGLGLLLPVLTGAVFDWVIPSADRVQLVSVFVALAVAALAATAFELTRSIAVIRLHARVSSALQMAVLDRLVRLPLPFFRRFTAGDLGLRASGISEIGNALSGATVSSILGSMVSAGAYVLLFVYSVPLALVATGILIVNVVFTAGTGYFSLRYEREWQEADGRLSGLVLQFLTGIAKLRISGTEARAFARWAAEFRRKQEVGFRIGRFHNNVGVFNSVLSIASTLLVFWSYTVLARDPSGGLTTGDFLAFNAAFGMFMSAGMGITGTAIGLLELVPLWERAKPILDEIPEVDPGKPDPGELTGRIEVNHLSFRYAEDGPLILDDVSLHADRGEFIALVGPSGAGKSTLLRILLAFDMAESSSVYYDGHDLATIDVTAVRRQIGVVLQSSRLTSGDIFTNIVGTAALTMEDAWEAARMAGMEEDLRDMPMGMHTIVSEGGSTLSGGQRQRLLIARALVHRPRILFFDEATSALDNRTQKIVSESIEQLHATRVVIAHRLSTIRHADRIYVLDQGRRVQAGSFDELMAGPGLFAELAARQEA